MADAAEKCELGATIARAESASAEVVCSMRATNAAENGLSKLYLLAFADRLDVSKNFT